MDITIVIPAYNEEDRIDSTIKNIKKYFSQKKEIKSQILVVDDGSTDRTVEVAKKLGCEVLSNDINRGKGYSVRNGMLHAKTKYALITDADLSTPIEEFDKFLNIYKQYDIVIGSRKLNDSNIEIKQPFYRVMAGNAFPMIVNLFFRLGVKDTQCGFKLFNLSKSKVIFKKQKITGFAFDVELMFLAKKANLKIKEVGVMWENEPNSKLDFLRHPLQMFVDLIRIRLGR